MRQFKTYIYKNYEISYDLFYNKEDKIWSATVDTYDDDMKPFTCKDSNKRDAELKLFAFFKIYIDDGFADYYIRNHYKIYPVFPDVLLSVRDNLTGYHISSKDNRESIMTKGLVADGNQSKEVQIASQLIDSDRPFWVPKHIIRETSNYVWPMMTNYCLGQKHYNEDLYAVKINHLDKCWVGSQGVGGFCLCYEEDFTEDQLSKYIVQIKKKYTKTYWKASCSLKSYLKNGFRVKHIDHYWGLDEILLSYDVPVKDLVWLGYWDVNGVFKYAPKFEDYVRMENKLDYKRILEKYKEF